jgi:hypothetical protein
MKTHRSPVDQVEFMRNLLAFLLVGAFIGLLPALFMIAIPDANKDIITYMVGQLSGMALTALGFYFVNKVGQDALDAKRTDNTAKAFDAIKAAQESAPAEADPDAIQSGDKVELKK